MATLELDALFSYDVRLRAMPEVIGKGPDGIRVNFFIERGSINGPQIFGSFPPGGGDWMTIRPDGVAILDVRATIDASLGPMGLIFMTYTGIVDFGRDGFDKWDTLLRKPQTQPFKDQTVFQARSAPRFFTADPNFEWLNRLQCVAFGTIDVVAKSVHFDVFSVAPSEFRLSQRIQLPSTPAQVFAHWMDPAKLRQLLPIESGTLQKFEVDAPHVNRSFEIAVATSVDVQTYKGTFTQIVPNEELVFTWKSNHSIDTTVTVEFDMDNERERKTNLTLTQFPFPSRESRDHYLEIWNTSLKNLAGYDSANVKP